MPCFKSEKQRRFMGAHNMLNKDESAKMHSMIKSDKSKIKNLKRLKALKEGSPVYEKREHTLMRNNLNRASSMGYLTKSDLKEAYALGVVNRRTYTRMNKHAK